MRVSERVELVSRIGRELQDRYTFTQLYSYLGAFGIERIEGHPQNSKWVYVRNVLERAPLELVLRIATDLDIVSSAGDGTLPANWSDESGFRLFISHLAKDKLYAARLKDALRPHGVSAFVAHNDIHPTKGWQIEIERALRSMQAMVAIHTKGFSASTWTQQEVGFALGRGTKVISFKVEEDPTGFIGREQAVSWRHRRAPAIAEEIVSLLKEDGVMQ